MAKKFKSGRGFHSTSSSTGDGPSLPVILYQHSPEATPLLPGKQPQRRISTFHLVQIGYWCFALVTISFMLYNTSMHFIRCPLDSSTRDSIRLGWEREMDRHTAAEHEWQHKAQEQATVELGWKREKQQHESEMAQRIHEEQLRQERAQEEWTREMERHSREVEDMQRREREEQDRERQEWKHEVERHAREFEEMQRHERVMWEQERRRWRKEVEEREQREEEERQRRNMHWGHVDTHTCTTYATREYSAQLMNLPTSWKHPLEACKNTLLEIHGVSHIPKSCEVRGPGIVIGQWEMNQQEPGCTTYWDGYDDKGCTSPGSGKRHFTHKLMNLPEGSDWREFCATTPISFNHMQFPGAQECFTTMWGIYGRWEMDDGKC